MKIFILLLMLVLPVYVMAEEAQQGMMDAPLPEDVEDSLEPQVTIIQEGETAIKEYRVNGRLYMIEIVPRKGRPYYLVDADGDGNLETRQNDLLPDFLIPAWVLKRW
jgi:hypothetical protein